MEKDLQIVKTAYKALDDKFGSDIVILDIRGISILADFFIIATGNNPSNIKAMSDEAVEKLHEAGVNLHHVEGLQTSNWVLLDFTDIIIHIFDKENRSFYNLERVWSDARVIKLEELEDNKTNTTEGMDA